MMLLKLISKIKLLFHSMVFAITKSKAIEKGLSFDDLLKYYPLIKDDEDSMYIFDNKEILNGIEIERDENALIINIYSDGNYNDNQKLNKIDEMLPEELVRRYYDSLPPVIVIPLIDVTDYNIINIILSDVYEILSFDVEDLKFNILVKRT
jgi:hypothetical protein